MRESSVEKAFKREVEKVGGWCLKIPALHASGIPDRLCLFPGGRAVFAELKAKGKKPRKIQLVVHRKLEKLGFPVAVIDSTQQVKDFINGIIG